jgi:hypothetical protein
MPDLARARQAVERLLTGGAASAGAAAPAQRNTMQAQRNSIRPIRTSAILQLYLRLCRFATWVDDYLNAARSRNEALAIEETKTYLRAKRRALTLMLGLLNPEQREEFRRYRHFHVIGGATGTRYRIRVAAFANIDVLGPTGRTMYRLCVHPGGDVPVYDAMAAQMLHLQDPVTEKSFLKQANVHPVVAQDRRAERVFWIS